MNIAFAHNVYDRFKTLLATIEVERKYYPDSKIVVAYNEPEIFNENVELFKDIQDIEFILFQPNTHKAGCVNGFLISVAECVKHNPDVIIFSHDDVRINEDYFSVVTEKIEQLKDQYSVICRKPEAFGDHEYTMMECVYMTKEAAINIVNNEFLMMIDSQIPLDHGGSISPEKYFENLINRKISADKILKLTYNHNEVPKYNEILGGLMGYSHLNVGKRGWKD